MGLGDFLKNAKNAVETGVKQITNKKYLDAVVASCALVAGADGSIDDEEKEKMLGFIQRNEALKVFDMSEVAEKFNGYVDRFTFDPSIGKQTALTDIGKIKNKKDEARMCITVCIAIAKADGDFDAKEKQVIKEICKVLGLSAGEFNI